MDRLNDRQKNQDIDDLYTDHKKKLSASERPISEK